MPVLEGRLVTLRDFRRDDLDTYAHWLAPGREWRRLDGPYYPEPTAAEVAGRIAALRERIDAADWPEPRTRLAITAGDALVGSVSRYWISEETLWAALGIDIYDPDLWGRGLGHEALRLWTDYVFDTSPELPRLDLRTWSGNSRMMRLAERLGFRLEARFRRARGDFDALGYGILREEWERRSYS